MGHGVRARTVGLQRGPDGRARTRAVAAGGGAYAAPEGVADAAGGPGEPADAALGPDGEPAGGAIEPRLARPARRAPAPRGAPAAGAARRAGDIDDRGGHAGERAGRVLGPGALGDPGPRAAPAHR